MQLDFYQRIKPPHLHLSIQEERDAPAIFALIEAERPRLRKTLPWPDSVRSVEDSLKTIRDNRILFGQAKSAVYLIRWDGEIAGLVAFNTLIDREGTIGYWISSAFEGKSVAYAAVSCLIEWYTEADVLDSFVIRCSTENERSARLAERLGFQLDTIVEKAEKIGDRYLDHRVYRLSTKG
ncbi:Ribosomal-protein-serine acetyltransferase [Leminorella richardii]|uniref:Ribosomal-protein-serine acetyltransferase n=1 Tax=Leminorella richardii TaxID=158841 RepID=A0A2X4USJ9_9GAMM|nr:GNAT family N-acetyltransferase [Leminorella richardii]SQI36000.1 Ribosomal-protein-serine acetyltransferase [Leminorella richardii]